MTAPDITSVETTGSVVTPVTYETVYCTKYALSKGILRSLERLRTTEISQKSPIKPTVPYFLAVATGTEAGTKQ
jgi:hypothetical protein